MQWALWWMAACGTSDPADRFDAATVPAAPDYAQQAAWAARPDMADNADLTPPKIKEQQAIAPADAFYIHPTTYFAAEPLNADPLANSAANEWVDQVLLAEQASVLNGCCRVFAPRYRQASATVQRASQADAQAALSVAYEDVRRAFDEFIAQSGDRPFVLAAHEQGSAHAMRLLSYIDGEPDLRERLVVAYVPGYAHPRKRFGSAYPTFVPCDEPNQVGCIAAWDTYETGASTQGTNTRWYWDGEEVTRLPIEAVHCTNPITWAQHERASPRNGHKGAIGLNASRELDHYAMEKATAPQNLTVEGLNKPTGQLLRASCETGFLKVYELAADWDIETTTSGNYHLADWELFSLDIRVNAWMRVLSWNGRKQDRIRAEAGPEAPTAE